MKGHALRGDDNLFLRLTKGLKLKTKNKMAQKSFMHLLDKWIKAVGVKIIVNGCAGCFTFHSLDVGHCNDVFLIYPRCPSHALSGGADGWKMKK